MPKQDLTDLKQKPKDQKVFGLKITKIAPVGLAAHTLLTEIN